MTRYMSLDDTLLKGFEYPVCLVVEVTKQGVLLSKLRYLKTLGQVVNETIRCPVIEVYMHMGRFVDPFLQEGRGRPVGIDWIFGFDLDSKLFREMLGLLREGKAKINRNNPMVTSFIRPLMNRVDAGKVNFKRLDGVEKGLLLEPYCRLAFQKAGGEGCVTLQNAELIDREAAIRIRGPGYEDIYTSDPGPVMEIDILVITEISDVRRMLDGLRSYGFHLDRPA